MLIHYRKFDFRVWVLIDHLINCYFFKFYSFQARKCIFKGGVYKDFFREIYPGFELVGKLIYSFDE